VAQSIKYLKTSLALADDPRVTSRSELPISETYINISNAYLYLDKLDDASSYAEKAYSNTTKTIQ
jgi:hypothetical protein